MRKISVIFSLLLLFTSVNFAQNKFGYLNSSEVLMYMPEMKDVQKGVEEYQNELMAEYKTKEAEYQKKYQEYELGVKNKTWSEGMMKLKAEEIQTLGQSLEGFAQLIENELYQKQAILMKPLQDKLTKAINELAKEKGLTYVFDTSKGAIAHLQESDNLFEDLKKKLGLVIPTTTPK